MSQSGFWSFFGKVLSDGLEWFLIQSIKQGSIKNVRHVIKKGADINKKVAWGGLSTSPALTPLYYALDWGEFEIARILIEHGADLYEKDFLQRNLLMHFAWSSDRNHDPLNPARVAFLIEAGLSVHARDKEGYTPLMYASDPHSARVLIEHGADIDDTCPDTGETALMCAIQKNMYSCPGINDAMVRFLIEAGVDVNAKTHRGKTALMEAVHNRSGKSKVLMLLNAGADVHAQDNEGKTALMHSLDAFCAVLYDYPPDAFSMLYALLERGADINHQDHQGETFLMQAAYMGWDGLVVFLLKNGAKRDLFDKKGNTAITFAYQGMKDFPREDCPDRGLLMHGHGHREIIAALTAD